MYGLLAKVSEVGTMPVLNRLSGPPDGAGPLK